jgi:hypothetical protein
MFHISVLLDDVKHNTTLTLSPSSFVWGFVFILLLLQQTFNRLQNDGTDRPPHARGGQQGEDGLQRREASVRLLFGQEVVISVENKVCGNSE